jgi:hypothetical protein
MVVAASPAGRMTWSTLVFARQNEIAGQEVEFVSGSMMTSGSP